jgi:hypothetical protein
MQIKHHVTLINKGEFPKSEEFKSIINEINTSITKVVWPLNSDKFIIYPESGKKRGEGNGVKPIKNEFVKYLQNSGWELETKFNFATVRGLGGIDATRKVGSKHFAVEWETGNISSSHRALNKMALGLLKEELVGGILVVPTRDLYTYLTDRVGNFAELEPYFPLWKSINCVDGYLGVIAIEHDGVSKEVPKIPKGTDGRALN